MFEEQSRRARGLQDTHPAARLFWSPPEGGWGIGQVFEHLCITNDSYLMPATRLVDGARIDPAKARTATWRPTVMGNILVRSFSSGRRLPAPRIYRPGPAVRDEVVAAFLSRQEAILALLERSADAVWQELRLRSPVTWLIRVNLGDAFAILGTHTDRHFRQIERIERNGRFPR